MHWSTALSSLRSTCRRTPGRREIIGFEVYGPDLLTLVHKGDVIEARGRPGTLFAMSAR